MVGEPPKTVNSPLIHLFNNTTFHMKQSEAPIKNGFSALLSTLDIKDLTGLGSWNPVPEFIGAALNIDPSLS